MTRRFLIYLTFIAAAVLTVAGLLKLGSLWFPLQVGSAPAASAASSVLAQIRDNTEHPLSRLILQLMVVIVAARAMGAIAGRVGQPSVVGEITAGILLGPSLLGWALPAVSAYLFPPASLPTLQLLSQIGVLLFMFVVGAELDPARMRGKTQSAIAVSHCSIVIPFALGVGLSLWLYKPYAPAAVAFPAFGLFCGIAMSITAFPVLARILRDRGLSETPLGSTAIACAAVDDVTAWSILALVVAITTAGSAVTTLLATLGLSTAFVLVMFALVRPTLRKWLGPAGSGGSLSTNQIAIALVVLLASAFTTETIGIHGLFGAFIAGAIMPTGGTFRAALCEKLDGVGSVFLLPLFFVYTGLRTQLGLLDDARSWVTCLAIILVATVGKLGGTVVAARWTGLGWRDSVALGALMNTRGLMELIALNVGYELGILTPEIFAMMVMMALVTTAMTGPLVSLSLASHIPQRRTRS